jgi:hypothetical protein
VWAHYDETTPRGSFYGTTTKSSITFVFNPKVSMSKVFQTVNYEGSNGWQVDSFISDATGLDLYGTVYESTNDKTLNVFSYVQGAYDSNTPIANTGLAAVVQPIYRAGFDRKENKYFANLVNNSAATQGEILWGMEISGIKGYFATVTVSTDSVTNVGGPKDLFAVSSNFVESSY